MRWHLALLSSLLTLTALHAEPVSPANSKFFESKIRPILVESCWSCHGPEKQRGGLRLDSRAAILRGGDLGSSIDTDQPAKSLLLKVIRYDDDLKMPPKGKLSPAQIADLEQWVKLGLPWPDGGTPRVEGGGNPGKTARDHWAFQPRRADAPPLNGAHHPIDAFLHEARQASGLTVAPLADRRTLIRRVTFDLTGLPPTPAEVEAFVQDAAPDAWSRVIDRLLQSPAYGERWGRHWLDVARYADSNGMDENLAHAHAYRYRDWVIRALNDDLPFDQFLRMQIAGDLLAGADGLSATGFLMIGPKMLAEDDPVKMRMDIIDEQLDTIGQAFMGMTVGCARCHDHKFDPISARDYYALAGIFHSTKTMDSFKVVAKWQERPIADPVLTARVAAQQSRIDAVQRRIQQTEQKAREAIQARLRPRIADYLMAAEHLRQQRQAGPITPKMAAPMPPKDAIRIEAEAFDRGNVLRDRAHYGKDIGVLVNAGELPNRVEYDIKVSAAGRYRLEYRLAAADARASLLSVDNQAIGDIAADVTGGWFPEHQRWYTGPVLDLKAGAHTLKLTRQGPFPHLDQLALVPIAANEPIPLDDAALARERNLELFFLRQTVAYLDRVKKVPTTDDERMAIAQAGDGPFALPKPLDPLLPADMQMTVQADRAELAKLQAETPVLPVAMAVSDDAIGNVKVHIRGNHLTLGEEVPRGFLKLFQPTNGPAVPANASGRLELANWLTHPDHPLTARVIVNRVWLWHFGSGLVRTPDNFGTLGDIPVQRALLDWLANRLIADGWSLKRLHRLILTSEAYQRSTAYDPAAALRDPDNRLYWRWNRQRLAAESLRDTLNFWADSLDRRMGGSILKTPNRQYVTSTANRNYDGYDSPRRAVYLPIVRSALYEPFQALDFPDPSVPAGQRDVTTVPPQALLMMNSTLVTDTTARIADRLLGDAELDDRARIAQLYRWLYAQEATPAEIERALVFLAKYEQQAGMESPRQRAWQGLCRVLVSSNRFLYVE